MHVISSGTITAVGIGVFVGVERVESLVDLQSLNSVKSYADFSGLVLRSYVSKAANEPFLAITFKNF